MKPTHDAQHAKLNARRPWLPVNWRLIKLGRRTVLDLRAARGL